MEKKKKSGEKNSCNGSNLETQEKRYKNDLKRRMYLFYALVKRQQQHIAEIMFERDRQRARDTKRHGKKYFQTTVCKTYKEIILQRRDDSIIAVLISTKTRTKKKEQKNHSIMKEEIQRNFIIIQ